MDYIILASGSYFRKKKVLFIVFVSLLVTGHIGTHVHTYMCAHIDNVGSLGNTSPSKAESQTVKE